MKLSDSEFKATTGAPMTRMTPDSEPPFDFWDYLEAIPAEDFEGHDCTAGNVTYVWQTPDGAYQHVLIDSDNDKVFMAIVLDVKARRVAGHRLLDMRSKPQ